ncbi:spore germination protein [Neobacillus niacini]|uniref:spore germination protein n=1 Tax=Neobacillus niacini TaxID=86668 RepID=UPI000694A093|nr:spore germination protein [Neobacillus niacini]
MENTQNVHHMDTGIISENGNINFGSTVQNSHTANKKATGAAFTFGDCSNIYQFHNKTQVVDINKQEQSETP